MKSKNLLFSFSCLLIINTSYAQNVLLMGINSHGGTPASGAVSAGNIYSIFSNDSGFTQRLSFVNSYPGETPYGTLMEATNGKFYGMTSSGGSDNSGLIFSYDVGTAVYSKLFDFNDTSNDAQFPLGKLIQASNGKLYGLTLYGGTIGDGVLFSYDPFTSAYQKLLDFDDINTNDAQTPFGSLVEATNGKLYATANGGIASSGVLFSYDPATSTYTKHLDFNSGANDASGPSGSLMQASNGRLYGMTTGGGINGVGVLFSYNPVGDIYTKLYDFDFTNGANPLLSTLVEGPGSILYGMTNGGGTDSLGVLFKYDIALSSFTKVIDFDGTAKGSFPDGGLMLATDGKLYGMTSAGGTYDVGVAFAYDPVSTTFTKLFDFDGPFKGAVPWGDMLQASNGKLYGMTSVGGNGVGYYGPSGVVFSYEIATSSYTKLFDFNNGTNGNSPTGALTRASTGKFYGTAHGGAPGFGILFNLNASNNVFTKLHEFDFTNGAYPSGNLRQAASGLFYGTTFKGGADSAGVIFKLDPATNVYTKLVDFNGANGNSPNGGLLEATNGKLYGLTSSGGDSAYGVLYSYDPASGTYAKLFDFDGRANGSKPLGSLVQGNNGKLYGLTSAGGMYDNTFVTGAVGTGVLFKFDPSSNTYTKLHDFGDNVVNDGALVEGSLLKATNGKLYGTTTSGGTTGAGIMFEYDPVSDVYTNLYDFSTIFWRPWGDLMQASNGKIYGATSDTYTGSTFSFDPVSLAFVFNDTLTRGIPSISTALVEIPLGVGLQETAGSPGEMTLYPNPSNGKITVSFMGAGNNSTIKISNLLGEEVYMEKCTGTNVKKKINVNFPSGIYFVKVEDGEKQITKKLLIQE